jgi:hypothetical protein
MPAAPYPRARVWLEGLGQLKNPMTSSGIGPMQKEPLPNFLLAIFMDIMQSLTSFT